MVVEVNEKYHYTTAEQKERDAIRNSEIAKRGAFWHDGGAVAGA